MHSLEYRMTEVERGLANMLRVGTISQVDIASARARVSMGETRTSLLPWFTRRAGKDRDWWSPEVGEQVMVLSPSGDLCQGIILPAIYHEGAPGPAASADISRTIFGDGFRVEHDRAKNYTVFDAKDSNGTLELRAKNIILKTGEGGYFHLDHYGKATRLTHESGAIYKSESWTQGSVINSIADYGHLAPEVDPPLFNATQARWNEIRPHLTKAFEIERDRVRTNPAMTRKDQLLVCLPAIAKAEAARIEHEDGRQIDKQGWDYLKSFLEKWFSGLVSEDDFETPKLTRRNRTQPAFVDWDWLLGFDRVRDAWREITSSDYLFTEKSKAVLINMLRQDGFFNESREPQYFDYSKLPPLDWHSRQFTYYKVPSSPIFAFLNPDGLDVSLGKFALYPLAKGKVTRLKDRWQIDIEAVYIFIRDSFSFEGEQDLGPWDCEQKKYLGNITSSKLVYESDFRDFRSHHQRGRDFYVLARPRASDQEMADKFEGVTFYAS